MKHTKGPWEIRSDIPYSTHGFVIFSGRGEKNKTIARFSYGNTVGFGEPKDKYYRELKANIHLMAAAPELLDATKEALDLFNFLYPDSTKSHPQSIMKNLKQAIAKAEGRTDP